MSFKFFTKSISIFIVATILIGIMPVFAAYPTTWTAPSTGNTVTADSATALGLGTENAAWSFDAPAGVKGSTTDAAWKTNRSFVVLDKAGDGKYLMATNYDFGKLEWDKNFTKTNAVPYNVNYGALDESTNKRADGTNIGYVVNTYTDDDGGAKGLYWIGPTMREQMVESEWTVEAASGWGVEEYSVTAKAVIPSYTEYVNYIKRFDPSKVTADKIWLRSMYNVSTAQTGAVLRIARLGKDGSISSKEKNDTCSLQLLFWTNADFFKNVKVTNPGTGVKTELAALVRAGKLEELLDPEGALKYTTADVKSWGPVASDFTGYTIDELRGMGFTVEDLKSFGLTTAENFGGYSVEELIEMGFSQTEIEGFGISTAGYFGPAAAGEDFGMITDNSAYVFTAEGKEWIIFDTNEEGEFLLASNFSHASGTVFDSDAEKAAPFTLNFDSWKYNPDDTNNVAAKINATSQVSDVIRAKVKTKTWRVEQSVEYDSAAAAYTTNPSYTFDAEIVVPSYSEYKKYAGRVYMPKLNKYNGIWTRTPAGFETNQKTDLILTLGSTKNTMSTAVGSLEAAAVGTRGAEGDRDVQFMFWVDRSFFTDIKISGAGSEVKSALKAEYAKSELAVLYTGDGELEELGFTGETVETTNAEISGWLSVGQTIAADCDVMVNANPAANYALTAEWYYGSEGDGWTKIEGESGATLTIPVETEGEYIRAVISGTDMDGFKLPKIEVTTEKTVAAKAMVVVSNGTITKGDASVSASFALTGASASTPAVVFVGVYDANGVLKFFAKSASATTDGIYTATIAEDGDGKWPDGSTELAGTDVVRGFVWSDEAAMIPYALKADSEAVAALGTTDAIKIEYIGGVYKLSGKVATTNGMVSIKVCKQDGTVKLVDTFKCGVDGSFKDVIVMWNDESSYDCSIVVSGYEAVQSSPLNFYYANESYRNDKLTAVNSSSATAATLQSFYEADYKLLVAEETYKEYYKDETESKLTADEKTALFTAALAARNELPDKKFATLDDFAAEANNQLAFIHIKNAEASEVAEIITDFESSLKLDETGLFATADARGVHSDAVEALAGKTFTDTSALYEAYEGAVAFAIVDACDNWQTFKAELDTYVDYMISDSEQQKYYDKCDKAALAVYLSDPTVKATITDAATLEGAIKSYYESLPDDDDDDNGGGNGGGGGGTAITTGITTYAPAPIETPVTQVGTSSIFSDLKDFDWAKTAIEALFNKGIVSGDGTGRYAPNDNVTRGQFVKMVLGTFGLYKTGSTSEFSDVSEDAWEYTYVSCAYDLGIVNGMEDGSFGVNENITRQDMAVMIKRAAEVAGLELEAVNNNNVTDFAEISDYATEAVRLLTRAGIITGFEDGSFKPMKNASRAESAVMLYRVID